MPRAPIPTPPHSKRKGKKKKRKETNRLPPKQREDRDSFLPFTVPFFQQKQTRYFLRGGKEKNERRPSTLPLTFLPRKGVKGGEKLSAKEGRRQEDAGPPQTEKQQHRYSLPSARTNVFPLCSWKREMESEIHPPLVRKRWKERENGEGKNEKEKPNKPSDADKRSVHSSTLLDTGLDIPSSSPLLTDRERCLAVRSRVGWKFCSFRVALSLCRRRERERPAGRGPTPSRTSHRRNHRHHGGYHRGPPMAATNNTTCTKPCI